MRYLPVSRAQHGAVTLFMGLVMLLLLSSVVVAAFTLSTTNLRAVGNSQTRVEALALAQSILEAELGQPFHHALQARPAAFVDTDEDGTADYRVELAVPECVSALASASVASSSVTLPGIGSSLLWRTTWELRATVTDLHGSAAFTVVQGVRVLLSEDERNRSCP